MNSSHEDSDDESFLRNSSHSLSSDINNTFFTGVIPTNYVLNSPSSGALESRRIN
jgi:hypothetical protein